MAQLQGTLSAEYYPTDLRIVNFINYIHFSLRHKNLNTWRFKENHLESYKQMMQGKPEFKFKKDWYKIPDYNSYYFQEALNNNDMNYIYENFEHNYQTQNWRYNTVLFDGFCGKAEWLTNHNKFKGIQNGFTIGIELVKERADTCKENNVNLLFNEAFENVEMIPNSCSIIYFNPPYDSIKLSDGTTERLTKYYLKQIIEKDLLIDEGYMDLVIREDDFIDCLDLLYEYFHVDADLVFKAPSDEYNKFKQLIIIAKKRNRPFSQYLNNTTGYFREKSLEIKLGLNESIKNCPVIDVTKIPLEKLLDLRNLPIINIKTKLDLFKRKKQSENIISTANDNVWNWFKEKTTVKTNKIEDLTVALPLKTGEMTNMLASGILDGLIAEGTERNHVVVGGIEQIKDYKTSISYDSKNNKTQTIIVQKLNKPYLNILTSNGKILKLINKNNKTIESEDETIE